MMDRATRVQRLRRLSGIVPTTGPRAFGASRETHTHNGVDLLIPRGTDVFAVADGTITHASDALETGFSGYGAHVVLREGNAGPWYLFAHLDGVNVKPGDRVSFGDVLGQVGDTCFDKTDGAKRCNGVHLHYEVSPTPYPQANTAPRRDPVAWLAKEIERFTTPETSTTSSARTSTSARRALSGFGTALASAFALGLVVVGVMVVSK